MEKNYSKSRNMEIYSDGSKNSDSASKEKESFNTQKG